MLRRATLGPQVFRLDRAAQDVERLYATGLFDFVDLLPRASGTDAEQASRAPASQTTPPPALHARAVCRRLRG